MTLRSDLGFVLLVLLSFDRGRCLTSQHYHISLSPESWLPGEREHFERLSLRQRATRPKPLAFSNGKGLVAATGNPLAVHAGLHALRKDGNAMDACLTTALTDVTLSAGSHMSYAGVVNILYYDGLTGRTYNLDAGWAIPQHINPLNVPSIHTKRRSGASVLVPGFIAGVAAAAEKYGRFPLATLLSPALYFANKGFKIPQELAETMKCKYNHKTLLRTREGRNTFTNPKTRKPYESGELFKQPKLAKFIYWLSRQGKDYMYRGHWAEEMARTVLNNLGYVTMQDMQKYQALWLEPARATYRGHDIVTTGAEWSGTGIVESLNLLELAGIGQDKDSYLTNATEFSWLASVAQLTHSISMFLHAVPKAREEIFDRFGLEFLPGDRLTQSSADALWQKTPTPKKMREMSDFLNKILGGEHMDLWTSRSKAGGVVAVDIDGNVCSLMHSAGSEPWGTGLFVKGVALPHPASILKPFVKLTGPGQRLPTGLHPLIVFKADSRSYNGRVKRSSWKKRTAKSLNMEFDEKQTRSTDPERHEELEKPYNMERETRLLTIHRRPFSEDDANWPGEEFEESEQYGSHVPEKTGLKPVLALATNGQASQEVVLQYLTNALHRGLDPKATVESPGFFLIPSPQLEVHVEENAFDPNLILNMRKMGQRMREVDYETLRKTAESGAVVKIDEKHKLYGCTSPLADGLAEGSFEVDEEYGAFSMGA